MIRKKKTYHHIWKELLVRLGKTAFLEELQLNSRVCYKQTSWETLLQAKTYKKKDLILTFKK